MKTLTLMLAPATFHLARAGEIAGHYQPETNDFQPSDPFAGPRMSLYTNGISEIGIERTACFGPCPDYVCIIGSKGVVRFHREVHVDRS